MNDDTSRGIGRRELLVRSAPACALGCLGLLNLPEALAADLAPWDQETHKFDEPREAQLSVRAATRMQYSNFFEFVRTLRTEIGEPELIRLLNVHSTGVGERQGETQAQNSPDREFQTFVATFRPPRYARTLTHEVVEDTENAFGLRVTECIWAAVFREAGLDGEIGHAAVCNMDYAWPTAFNPSFKMERTRTLMQGHDHCNHRYVRVADKP